MTGLMFVLPTGGGSGGAHSVMQEAEAMWKLGVPVVIASNGENARKLRHAYRHMPVISKNIQEFSQGSELADLIDDGFYSFVIATANQSVDTICDALKIKNLSKSPKVAYYIQDYEPFFYKHGTDDWIKAHRSYDLLPNILCFSKTKWLKKIVEANHDVEVSLVSASVDHDVFYPHLPYRLRDKTRLRICGMIRPSTPRRAPRRTARILSHVADAFGQRAECISFGCTTEDLNWHNLRLNGVEHLGVLPHAEVGDLFRTTDLFLDLSDYQAFGRSAIEAMSCGAVSVVPILGGSDEFVLDAVNGYRVDTRVDAEILSAVAAFAALDHVARRAMSIAAVEAGFRYSPEQAALSELTLLEQHGFLV